MKIRIFIFCSILCCSTLLEVNAGIPPKRPRAGNNSCSMSRSITQSDLVEYRFGIVAGQNISTIKNENDNATMDILPGLMGGVAAQIIWPMGLVIQPEALYSQKGSMFSGSGLKYKVEYVEIPVKIMYRLHITDIKPFAFVAPYGAYALKITKEGEITSDEVPADDAQLYKWDYGIGAGAGFDIWKIQLSFKYSWGFAKILKDDFTIKNKVFNISAGIFF